MNQFLATDISQKNTLGVLVDFIYDNSEILAPVVFALLAVVLYLLVRWIRKKH